MSANLGTVARWRINCSQGNFRLRRVKDWKISDGTSREAQNASGETTPIGTFFKPGPQTITFSVYFEQANPEVDYDALKKSGEWFTLEMEIVGGKSFQFVDVQVSKKDSDGDENGKNMFSVELLAMDVQPL